MQRSVPLVAIAILLLQGAALAQPRPAASPAPPVADAVKQEARAHFDKAVSLFEEGAWDPALVEFLRSRDLFPTRAALKNAALCLYKLHRYDEALEMFETLLHDFPDLGAEDRAVADKAAADLKGLVGAVNLRGARPGAAIAVDGRSRGVFPSSAPLRVSAGTHAVRVTAEGFVPFETQVRVAGGQVVAIDVSLQALKGEQKVVVVQGPAPANPSRVTLEAHGGLAIVPSFGGEVAGCQGACSKSIGLGGYGVFHGGYQLGSGLGFGLALGYLAVNQRIGGRVQNAHPVGLADNPGTASDVLGIAGPMLGATASFHLGNKVPVLFRLGGGALLATVNDLRSGSFVNSHGEHYDIGTVRSSSSSPFVYVAPEARVGLRFGGHFEATIGAEALILIATSPPHWDSTLQVTAKSDGIATFPAAPLTSNVVFAIVPTAGLRFDF